MANPNPTTASQLWDRDDIARELEAVIPDAQSQATLDAIQDRAYVEGRREGYDPEFLRGRMHLAGRNASLNEQRTRLRLRFIARGIDPKGL